MEKQQSRNYQIILVRLPQNVVDTLNNLALKKRSFLRSEIINDFFRWGFDEFIRNGVKRSVKKTAKKIRGDSK